jgi:hypothetical protein
VRIAGAVKVEVEVVAVAEVLIIQESITVKELVEIDTAIRIEVVLSARWSTSHISRAITCQARDPSRGAKWAKHVIQLIDPCSLFALNALQLGQIVCVAANLVQ